MQNDFAKGAKYIEEKCKYTCKMNYWLDSDDVYICVPIFKIVHIGILNQAFTVKTWFI